MQKREPEKGHYLIRRSLISTDYREKIIRDSIEMYLRGEDIRNSPLVEWGRMCLERGDVWWYGCEGKEGDEREKAIQARMRYVIDLYWSLKQGYTGTPISVYFDETGQLRLYDGFHRISIMTVLDMDPLLNVVIAKFDPSPELRGEGDLGAGQRDFPLVETLVKLNQTPESKYNSYHPIDDPRVAHFHIWRQDTQKRLDLILPFIKGETILDIGCSEGFFSRELTKRGFKVTALDINPRRLAVTRYLSIINNLSLDYITGGWEHEVRGRTWDTILMLSVLHHHLLYKDIDTVSEYLSRLRGCCKTLILESPLTSRDLSWPPPELRDTFKFTVEGLGEFIEEATGMKQIALFRIPGDLPPRDFEIPVKWARRPLFILEASE